MTPSNYVVQYMGTGESEPKPLLTPPYDNTYATRVPVQSDSTVGEVKTYLIAEATDAELPEGITEDEIIAAIEEHFRGNFAPDQFTTRTLPKNTYAWFMLSWKDPI